MSGKNAIQPFPVIVDGDMSTTITSLLTDTRRQDNVCYQIKWSGTAPDGECFVDVTLDDVNSLIVTPVWTTLDFGLPILIASNSGSHVVNVNQSPFAYSRLRYVPNSGVGVLNVKVETKSMGG